MNRVLFVGSLAFLALVTGIFTAEARPQYAAKEGKSCAYCHLNPSGGGARGFRGIFYGANNLSFANFEEEREAAIAGVTANASDAGTDPKLHYVGNVTGPADRQVSVIAIHRPALVIFFTSADDNEKNAAKLLRKVANAYGTRAGVVGIMEGDTEKALKLTKDLGNQLRILPDANGDAMKKYGATQGLDLVAVSKLGETTKLYSGYSKANLESAIAQIGTFGVAAPEVDINSAPTTVIHGAKLGG